MADDAARVAPHVYRVLFENDRVRLLEVRMKPGEESALHSHPDYLIYALEGGTVELSDASGQSAQVTIEPGEKLWRDAEVHSARNVGSTEMAALFFEVK